MLLGFRLPESVDSSFNVNIIFDFWAIRATSCHSYLLNKKLLMTLIVSKDDTIVTEDTYLLKIAIEEEQNDIIYIQNSQNSYLLKIATAI